MVSPFKIINCSPDTLHLDVLPRIVKKAFLSCIDLKFLASRDWYLAGGTALALQAGHRQSIDLDFFSTRGSFDATGLERRLFSTRNWATSFRQDGTLYGKFMDAKMSFVAYPFFRPSVMRVRCGKIYIILPHDIAAMKIIAISQRGRKRDFIDLYWYCLNREPLIGIIKRAVVQYPGQKHNLPHFLKSLTYFADAENDPMPRLFFEADWAGVKKFFQNEVRKAAREFLL